MIKDLLIEKQDLKYKDFTIKLLNDDSVEVIGVRAKDIRDIAKKVDLSILDEKTNIYEIRLIKALLIARSKKTFKEKLELLNKFIKQQEITNWAITDTLASAFKDFKKNLSDGMKYIKELLVNDDPFVVRLGIVFLKCYYCNDKYYKEAVELIMNTKLEHYYVKMAKAWALCEFYIYNKETKNYFKNLDQETYKMIKQKIKDSYRISKEDKEIPI
jgi:3-methyladenine DNA glycosylase AlkD